MKIMTILTLLITMNSYAALTCSQTKTDGLKTQIHSISASFGTNHLLYQISENFMTRAGQRTTVYDAIYSLVKIDKEEWKLEKIAGNDWIEKELALVVHQHSLPNRVCYPNIFCSFYELELQSINGESIMKCKTETSYGSSL